MANMETGVVHLLTEEIVSSRNPGEWDREYHNQQVGKCFSTCRINDI
jgi:hypothetical protein